MLKHLFSVGNAVAAYSDIVQARGPSRTHAQSCFVVHLNNGAELRAETWPLAECDRQFQQFVAAWDAFRDGKSPRGSTVSLEVKKLRPDAIMPVRSSEFASCFDICAADKGSIAPGQRAVVKTGLSMAVPPGYEIQVRSRSGHAAKAGVFVLNSPGTVDSDYRGEVGVILENTGSGPFVFGAGDRIAQIAVCAVEMCAAVEVETLSLTGRGEGGFGSTGTQSGKATASELAEPPALLPRATIPTWRHVKGALEQLPRGWQVELSVRLAMTPSGLSKMLSSKNDPRYDQVIACLRYLAVERETPLDSASETAQAPKPIQP